MTEKRRAVRAIVRGGLLAAAILLACLALRALPAEAAVTTEAMTGKNRYATARLFCEAFADDQGGAPSEVILVTGEAFPDALAANALAGLKECPIVITAKKELSAATAALLKDTWRGAVQKVTFVGGGFDPAVKTALMSECGVGEVDDKTFAGSNRNDTAERVCKAVMAESKALCIVASGATPADALAAAPWSFRYKIPILLTNKKGAFPDSSKNLASQFSEVLILGGDSAVPASAESALGAKALRIGGNNRYETAANIASYFAARFEMAKARGAVVALGADKNFPDALISGPYAGQRGLPVLLTKTSGINANAQGIIRRMIEPADALVFAGAAGKDSVPKTVAGQIGSPISDYFLTGSISKPSEDAGVARGVYEILPAGNTGLAVTVPGGALDDVSLVLQKDTAASSQKYLIAPVGGGKYTIINEASGRSVDIPSASTASRTAVGQHRRNQSAAQTFYIRKGPDGTCAIVPTHTDKPVSVKECDPVSGAGLQIYHYRGAPAQFFALKAAEAGPLTAGTYAIHSAADDSLVLTMAKESGDKGVLLRFEKAATSKAGRQRFIVSRAAGGWILSPLNSGGLMLDIKDGTMTAGNAIQQYTRNGSTAQAWFLESDGAGGFQIASAKDPGYGIADAAAGTADASLQGLTDGNLWQTFTFEKFDADRVLPDGVYNIAAFADISYGLDVAAASRALKANVQLYKLNGTNSQQFSVLYQGGGFYKIKGVNSALTLDIAGGATANGTNVQQYKDNNSEAQKWRFVSFPDGSWQIVSKKGPALSYESLKAKANIRIWAKNDSAGERFTVKPVKTVMITDIKDMVAGSKPEEGTFDRSKLDRYFVSYTIAQNDAVFNRMSGKSYPAGCPIPLSSLRYIKALHYNFDGKVQVGEMVVNASIAGDVTAIFKELFNNSYQIRQMRLIDDFWTGDAQTTDLTSVTADNSAGFNYRHGTNQTTGLSNHAYGYAVDINPRENPYIEFNSAGQISYFEPSNAQPYLDRSTGNPHYITSSDLACRLFKQRGFRWLGDSPNPVDYQHFERVG